MSGGYSTLIHAAGGISLNVDSSNIFAAVSLTAPGSTNTKGAWKQIVASTASDTSFIGVSLVGAINNNNNLSMDIGVGAAASEIVIVADLMLTGVGGLYTVNSYFLPVTIPAGTRMAARFQMAASGTNCSPVFQLYGSEFGTSSDCGVDALGFVSAFTQGTTIDPGTSGSTTKGSYAQLVASTPRDYAGLLLNWDNLNNTTQAADRMNIDVAIGGAGSEVVIVPDWFIGTFGSGAAGNIAGSSLIPVAIPAGTRVSARAASSNAVAGTRIFGLTAYGLYQ